MIENITENMMGQISRQDMALIWGTLRNIVNFKQIKKSTELMITGTIKGVFPIYSYHEIFIEFPQSEKKMDVSGRSNNYSKVIKKDQWISQRLIKLPIFHIENNDYNLLEKSYKSLIKAWNDSLIPKEIPCLALGLKAAGAYCSEREAQFARILLIWESGTSRIIDLELFEGPLEDCISPEWYINVSDYANLTHISPKFRGIDNYLPNWMDQTYSLFVIPSFLTNLLKFGKKGYFNNNGWNYEYNYQTREELQSDLNILLSKIDSFF
ncbi:MAG: hypothetical protein ACTSWX_05810 [Promethearchaeota archaeon]